MSGRHRNDFPEGAPGEGMHDPSRPVFGPANDGSSDWFGPRDSQSPPVTPSASGPAPGASGATPQGSGATPQGSGATPQGSGATPQGSGSAETPEWYVPRPSGGPSGGPPRSPSGGQAYGTGGFTGASDAGGYGLGRPAAEGGAAGPPAGAGMPGGSAASSGGYGEYDAISRSDGGETGFFGGRAGDSAGPGGPGGHGGSGGYGGGSGAYGGGEYGGRRKKRRSAGALIGPMAGAVGLALLLGVGVYAFAESGGSCTGDGAITLSVAVAPDIQPAVVKAAGRFNDAKRKVDGKCVKANVTKAEPAAVTTLLSGQGVANAANQRPDVWIPDTSLWTSMVRGASKGKAALTSGKTSLASSPIVVGLPQTLAAGLKDKGITATPSWDNLLKAAGGVAGGGVTKNQMIPPGAVRLLVPDPAHTSAGMASLMITETLLANDPNKESIFTGIVRTVRESTVPSVNAQFTHFRKGRSGKQPISLSSEQALWDYNRRKPAEPAVALYPLEGTLSMDYPFTVTSEDAAKQKAARLLEQAMGTEETRGDVRAMGFRTPDGKAPEGFGPQLGVSPARPRQLPAPKAEAVSSVMQAWSKLSLGLRMLTLIDVSGSMAEPVDARTNRLQALAQVSQGGLSMMSDDTELGQWLFSTKMQGNVDYQESVSVGPLGERVGSSTRRNLVLSTLNQMRPKMDGDTGLYDTVLAAYKEMDRTYKPEFGNSILLLTDGRNDDTDGPTLAQTLSRMKKMIDPNKPIQVNMIGFGKGVDRNELEQIAGLTNGNVQIAMNPKDISKIFLTMLSRRIQK